MMLTEFSETELVTSESPESISDSVADVDSGSEVKDPSVSAAGETNLREILQRVETLSTQMSRRMDNSIKEITSIIIQTRILSLNAQIEAALAGNHGRAFAVVASEMRELSEKTSQEASKLKEESLSDGEQITRSLATLGNDIRGTRLSDLAMTNIDIIDRNLYERSCDVRWWATDNSVVNALSAGTAASYDYASKRLGVILDAYTVYYDIVLCDLKGNVVANGRPSKYNSIRSRHANSEWFKSALATRNGSEFGFQSLHRNESLANGSLILVYSCTVREKGEANGKVLGVLGIIFNWESLAQTIVNNTPISADEKEFTRICIVDKDATILADTSNRMLSETLQIPGRQELFRMKKGQICRTISGCKYLIAHAFSPGYETYSTGFHSVIIQKEETVESQSGLSQDF